MGLLDPLQQEVIESILQIVVHELLIIKRSYFSTWGKDGWNPLKPETIKRKTQNKTVFNTDDGDLRDSLKVWLVEEDGTYKIKVSANHAKGDKVINQLIYTYGRNFLDFDDNELIYIESRIKELWELSYAI
jgi:hypothetical protein